MRRATSLIFLLALALLGGCATSPKVAENAERGITPTQAAEAQTLPSAEPPLQWGGVIVETSNLADTSELQILAYPLKSDGRPDLSAAPTGRFIARQTGYLESVDYRKGRQVTATGPVTEKRNGQVGEATYTFPVMLTEQLVLWPEESTREAKPRVNFGVGVGSGGRSWGGVGIGIGF